MVDSQEYTVCSGINYSLVNSKQIPVCSVTDSTVVSSYILPGMTLYKQDTSEVTSLDSGSDIAYYRVQLDGYPTFNGGPFGKPMAEVIVYSNSSTGRRPDVQVVTVLSESGFNPAGTFVLSFLGQRTGELDYNITAAGMAAALESLSTVNQVSVYRELFCSSEPGQNNCGAERGYVWMVTFLDVIEAGLQVEEFVGGTDVYESNFGSRFAVTGDYLRACLAVAPTNCYSNGTTVAFLDGHRY